MALSGEQCDRRWRPAELSSLASTLYRDGPFVRRLLMSLRPLICPFDELMGRVPGGSSVLDVGCGSGLFLGLLAASGLRFRGVGFDASRRAIQAARTMADRLGEQGREADLRFECLDARSPWPEGPFDVVSIIDVMHHVPPAERGAVLERACQATAPGGLLIYKDIAPRPRWRALANQLHDLVVAREWVRYTPLGDVARWGRRAGLELRDSRRIDRLWYGHELAIFGHPAAAPDLIGRKC
jgi:2-polyprenyl-3-methyl-5-hydroxy-6-metoxy-1,4-benzoquinol methylase